MWDLIDEENKNIKNIRKIFPLKQRYVANFVRAASSINEIKKIVIFGSSVEWRCNPWSDIDIYMEGVKHCPELLRDNIPKEDNMQVLDIWTDSTVDSRLLAEINKKGVTVYERGYTTTKS